LEKIGIKILICIMLTIASMPISSSIECNVFKNNELNSLTYNGTTLYVGGSGPGNYSSIQDAIDNANDGDTIFVYDDSSPYNEKLYIQKSINLLGENKETTIINGDGSGTIIRISTQHSPGITLRGFTIQNGGGTQHSLYGGISVSSSSYPFTICDNIITHDGWGIVISGCDISPGSIISNNTIINNSGGGIILCGIDLNNIIITKNIILNNSFGISIEWAHNNIITDNVIMHNVRGISLYKLLSEYNNTIITRNTISNNEFGIETEDSCNFIISENNITNNKYGMFIMSSTATISKNNIAENSKYGIYLYTSSRKNRITENNFINNTRHASFNIVMLPPKPTFNYWMQNYWDDWINIPFPKIIVGRLFYIVPKIEFDLHPAKEPYII